MAAIPATEGFVPGQAAMFEHHVWARVTATMARHYSARGRRLVCEQTRSGTKPTDADVLTHQRWFARPDQILMTVDSTAHEARSTDGQTVS